MKMPLRRKKRVAVEYIRIYLTYIQIYICLKRDRRKVKTLSSCYLNTLFIKIFYLIYLSFISSSRKNWSFALWQMYTFKHCFIYMYILSVLFTEMCTQIVYTFIHSSSIFVVPKFHVRCKINQFTSVL